MRELAEFRLYLLVPVVILVGIFAASVVVGKTTPAATLDTAVSVLEESAPGARVLLVAGQFPLVVVEGASSPAVRGPIFEKGDIVSIGATLGLTSQPGSECAIRDGARICLEPLAGEPVLTLERSEGRE